MDKLRLHEKLLIGFISVLLVVTFALVAKQRMLEPNEPLSVESYDPSEEAYDVSVVNRATYEEFLNVKGIGAAKATAIVEFREALGGFDSVYQIANLTAISDKLLDAIIEYFYESDAEPMQTSESVVASLPLETTTSPDVTSAPETTSLPEITSVTTSTVTTTHSTSAAHVTTTMEPTEPVQSSITSTEEEEVLSENDEEILDDETITDVDTEPIYTEPVMCSVEINYADADTIAECLLVDMDLACEIVSVREQIGRYTYVHELVLCKGLNMSEYERIKNFVIIS